MTYLPGRGLWVIKKAHSLGWRPALHLAGRHPNISLVGACTS
ncbi:unnamed protein product [Spirodela intermedia]|uniref:Uncharacterized protein n=1 Tax=Spirodela intermedia TaxID=51605 RepID=A0A7I8I7U4_SPIIN|nr:unnamed protein product [Spirodela intermedia]CAA6653453.1 unnamed protein product [Spirodela intermedia]